MVARVKLSVGVPASAWSSLDAVDLAAEFGTPVPTMQSVPVFLRHGVRQAFILARRALREAYMPAAQPRSRPAPGSCSYCCRGCCSTALASQATFREALVQRARDVLAGRWDALLIATRAAAGLP